MIEVNSEGHVSLDVLSLLKREADGMRQAIADIDGQLANAHIQRAGLQAMATALENEMDRIRASRPVEQLEFDLDE